MKRSTEKCFGRRDVPLGAQEEIDSLALFVDRAIEVGPTAFDLNIGLVDLPGDACLVGETIPSPFEFRHIAPDPAHDRRMRQRNASLGHHLHEISQAELEPEIPAHAENNDLSVEMAAFEKIINAQHPGPRPQTANLRQICPASAFCTRTAAWAYRMPAKIGQAMMLRQQSIATSIRDIAWKAQVRLCARYRRMLARGKKAPVVITAVARELVGFIWAIGQQIEPKVAIA